MLLDQQLHHTVMQIIDIFLSAVLFNKLLIVLQNHAE